MRRGAILAALLAISLAAGCGPSEKKVAADRDEIQAFLEGYLPKLAEAYATGDLAVLEGFAAAKEVARVEKRLEDLRQSGRVLEPTFHQVTVEQINPWNYANAFVNTVEVWDLELFAYGSHEKLSEEIGQSSRVKYQLKREGDSWLILFRTIAE